MDNLNHFTGYKESGQLKYRDSYYDIISKKSPYKIYYIVIQRDDSFRKTEYNITIVIYSTQTPLIVPDRCQTNFSVHSQNQTNYIFKIPENKYPAYFFGFLVFNGAFSVDFSIKENDGLKKYYGKRKTFFEQGIEMNINSSYTIYLEFSIRQYHMVETSSIYFYFIPSKITNFILLK